MIWLALLIIAVAAFNALFLSGKLPFLGSPPTSDRTGVSEAPKAEEASAISQSAMARNNPVGESKVEATCPLCAQKIRLPAGRSGDVNCPNCERSFFSDTRFVKIPSTKRILIGCALVAAFLLFVMGYHNLSGNWFENLLASCLFAVSLCLPWLAIASWGRRDSKNYFIRLKVANALTVSLLLFAASLSWFLTKYYTVESYGVSLAIEGRLHATIWHVGWFFLTAPIVITVVWYLSARKARNAFFSNSK